MTVIIACDKFKGSLSATQVRDALTAAIPGSRGFLVADGGDGTLEAALDAGFTRVPVRVTGPTGAPVDSAIARRDATVVLEMADLCGLLRLPGGVLAPLDAHSRGLGEALALAAEDLPARVVVGVGGSASTDGGTGLLVGLGARLLDAAGDDVAPGARHLHRIERLDLSGVPAPLRDGRVVLACDVDAPLLGPGGTVAVFGAQKGLTGPDADAVEAGLASWADVVAATVGTDVRAEPGAGAAGGVGFALLAALGARMEPGVQVVLEFAGFTDALAGARLVVTGEGRLDRQTLLGKTVAGVSRAAREHHVPVVAVCGRDDLGDGARTLGLTRVVSLSDEARDGEDPQRDAELLLGRAGRRIAASAARKEAPGDEAPGDEAPGGARTRTRIPCGDDSGGVVHIGLTGGIASGKSTVARRLVELGAALVDADELAREVVAPGAPALAEIEREFSGVVHDDVLDRAALAARVFSDPAARRRLEAITHPRIADLRRRRAAQAAAAGARVVVHDIPLLVETGAADQFDLVVVVHADAAERVARLVRERGMSEEDAGARIAAQASDEERRAVADVWLDNSGAREDLRTAVDTAWEGPIAALVADRRARGDSQAAESKTGSADSSGIRRSSPMTSKVPPSATS